MVASCCDVEDDGLRLTKKKSIEKRGKFDTEGAPLETEAKVQTRLKQKKQHPLVVLLSLPVPSRLRCMGTREISLHEIPFPFFPLFVTVP